MNATLVMIAGPRVGEVIPLTSGELSLGRDEGNELAIADVSLSRRHCVLRVSGHTVTIVDLDSLNGTFVDGVPVKERTLEHGNQIRIGSSQMLFLDAERHTARPAVELHDHSIRTRPTLQLPKEDVIQLQPERISSGSTTPLAARHLEVLLRLSTSIGSIRDRDIFQRQLLDSIFDILPVDHGAILLADEGQRAFTSVYGRDRASDGPVQVDRGVAERVLCDGVAILDHDVPHGLERGTVLCVPLMRKDRAHGVLYLAATHPAARLTEDHLRLVAGIAGISSLTFESISHLEQLERETERLRRDFNIDRKLVGESERMRAVAAFISSVGSSDATVIIRGETGTGKEVAARAIHQASPRAKRPFVAINCAALTENLLESELFGHEKGAFTGAVAQKKGKLEIAHGGTVFLDEIAEIAPALQAKLLRVLQEREFDRVGGTRPIRVDIRVIAATNRDLEEAVQAGRFRQDLYYRVNVISLRMPPLRERREDILQLARYFVATYADRCKKRIVGIAPQAAPYLLEYHWPGNVRELENAIERAVVLTTTDQIAPEDLPDSILESAPPERVRAAYHAAVLEAKKRIIQEALQHAGGRYVEAAGLLGLNPTYLHRLMRNMNLHSTTRTRRSKADS